MLTGILTKNRNVAHMVRLLEDHGATVTDVEYGSKHITVRFTTKGGLSSLTRLSAGPMDPLKLRNYARQAINRAGMREHARLQDHYNRR